MRVLGVELARLVAPEAEATLVLLDPAGRVARLQHAASLAEVASLLPALAAGEPFLAGVDVPIVVPATSQRTRAVENLLRRRFGFALPPGGRAALAGEPLGLAGESLLAGLATAGHPCLPYPDRDRRRSGLAEIHPGLALKALLWQTSPLARTEDGAAPELFRAYEAPSARGSARAGWAEQAVACDLVLRALADVPDLDREPALAALTAATTTQEVARARAVLDATLIASTARRYLEEPTACLFLGDREEGYLILPADAFIRRLAASETRTSRNRLFPESSLAEQLGPRAALRQSDLLDVPGRSRRTEVSFGERPVYEFDNVDEMLWWKHTRHLDGPSLPTEGLNELAVQLVSTPPAPAEGSPLRLVRSRHRTVSFRFDPPAAWRARLPTRDGRTYRFEVLRAGYETLSATADAR